MAESMSVSEAVAAGDHALARGAWGEARSCFAVALERSDAAAAYEGLSWTHWWQEDLTACLAAREHAYRGYRAVGDRRGAARMALWLGDDHLWYGDAPALADGWFARARRLLDGLDECGEHGWQAVFDAYVAIGVGDLRTARRLASEAQRIGRSQEMLGLQMFGIALDGVVLLQQGEIDAALRCLEEAATAALAGEFEELAPAAWACCLLLSACEELRDDERGAQWCQQVTAFGARIGASFVVGNCRSHQGWILTRCGRWPEAEQELLTAVERLADGPQMWHRDVLARLGDLRRRQGRQTEAERAFAQAGEQWLALAGRAALHLDAGDPAGAVELAERSLRRLPRTSPQRVEALQIGVRGRLALGDRNTAADHLDELRGLATTVGTSSLQAASRLAEARLAIADDDAQAAARHYADAVATYERADTPLEAALTRLEFARTSAAALHSHVAILEARQAHAALAELGAGPDADRAAQLIAELTGEDHTPAPCPLTPRQIEVLQLAADGLTERQIAKRLVLSEHTVHRHLANIYTRLGCTSRSAAVAQAARLGLL
jgi:LuxR family transcriptional regulator, maltose regulon positive regulatory protein